MAIGPGRNDGVTRLYTTYEDGTTYEFTWNGASWSGAPIADEASASRGVVVAKGRQADGIYSVFVASYDQRVYEYIWMTETPTSSPTSTVTPDETNTFTATPTISPTPTISETATDTPSVTRTSTITLTATISPTPTESPEFTPTDSPTITPTPTITLTLTESATRTMTLTSTITLTRTMTRTISPTATISPTLTISATASRTLTITRTGTPSQAADNLDQMVCYPNPFRGDIQPDKAIKFLYLPRQAELRIYSLDGQLVRVLVKDDPSNQAVWNLANQHGKTVASGIYLYLIKANGQTKRGKVMILK